MPRTRPVGAEISARSRRHLRSRGVTLVEFSLIAPVAFLLLLGTMVIAILVTDQISLSNGARTAVRAAAICGSNTSSTGVSGMGSATSSTTALPNGQLCTTANLDAYITQNLTQLQRCGSACLTVTVRDQAGNPVAVPAGASNPSSGTANIAGACKVSGAGAPYTVTLHASYNQPLFVPLVGYALGNGGTNTRTISAEAQAGCEQ